MNQQPLLNRLRLCRPRAGLPTVPANSVRTPRTRCLPCVEAILGSTLKQGNTTREVTGELLAVLTDAYQEAHQHDRHWPVCRDDLFAAVLQHGSVHDPGRAAAEAAIARCAHALAEFEAAALSAVSWWRCGGRISTSSTVRSASGSRPSSSTGSSTSGRRSQRRGCAGWRWTRSRTRSSTNTGAGNAIGSPARTPTPRDTCSPSRTGDRSAPVG
jgi:hypothetical protein